jgi:ribosomal protein S27E
MVADNIKNGTFTGSTQSMPCFFTVECQSCGHMNHISCVNETPIKFECLNCHAGILVSQSKKSVVAERTSKEDIYVDD